MWAFALARSSLRNLAVLQTKSRRNMWTCSSLCVTVLKCRRTFENASNPGISVKRWIHPTSVTTRTIEVIFLRGTVNFVTSISPCSVQRTRSVPHSFHMNEKNNSCAYLVILRIALQASGSRSKVWERSAHPGDGTTLLSSQRCCNFRHLQQGILGTSSATLD